MLIKYNRQNVHAIGTADGKEIHWLRPGWNEFPARVWDEHANDPELKSLVADGHIEFLAEKVKAGKGKPKIIGKDDSELHIKDLDEAKAIEVVKGTLNREMLERWIDEETRHKVKRALIKQIEPLLPENQASAS